MANTQKGRGKRRRGEHLALKVNKKIPFSQSQIANHKQESAPNATHACVTDYSQPCRLSLSPPSLSSSSFTCLSFTSGGGEPENEANGKDHSFQAASFFSGCLSVDIHSQQSLLPSIVTRLCNVKQYDIS